MGGLSQAKPSWLADAIALYYYRAQYTPILKWKTTLGFPYK